MKIYQLVKKCILLKTLKTDDKKIKIEDGKVEIKHKN
jgi:hypothetical protein